MAKHPNPNSLPTEWKTVTLGSISEIRYGLGQPPQLCAEGLPMVRATNIKRGRIVSTGIIRVNPDAIPRGRDALLRHGDIIVVRSGAYTGDSALVTREWVGAVAGYDLVISLRNGTDAAFCAFNVLGPQVQRYFQTQSARSAQPHLNRQQLREASIPSPPLPEQRKIAAVLSLIQRAIEQQDRLLALITELKKALLQKLFTEGLHGEPQKQTEIGPVPQSWQLTPCEDICKLITVGIVVRPASYYVETGVPAFRSLNVRADRLDTTDLVRVSPSANDSVLAKSKLQTGDVLVVRTGYPGTSCVVPDEFDGANCIDIVIAWPNDDVVISGFLSRFFNSPAGRAQALANKHGLAQQHLNVAAVKRMLVPVPNIQDQKEIDGVLELVQARIANTHRKRATLQGLFRTLLHQLMTAQIRVNHLDLSEVAKLLDHA